MNSEVAHLTYCICWGLRHSSNSLKFRSKNVGRSLRVCATKGSFGKSHQVESTTHEDLALVHGGVYLLRGRRERMLTVAQDPGYELGLGSAQMFVGEGKELLAVRRSGHVEQNGQREAILGKQDSLAWESED
jgi:hypothetical protein